MEGTFWRSRARRAPRRGRRRGHGGRRRGRHRRPGHLAPPPCGRRAVHTAALAPAVHDRLESVGAFSGHPVRFLMLGDSLAITASVGLAEGSVHGFGVQVIDQGVFGCDYDNSPAYNAGVRSIPFNSCLQWRTLYAADIAANHPDVVGLLTGRWTIVDRVVDGTTVHVGDPAFDAHVVAEYSDIVAFLSSQGVKVVLFNLPYFDPPQEAADGSVFPENRARPGDGVQP